MDRYHVQYRPGSENAAVDGLPRVCSAVSKIRFKILSSERFSYTDLKSVNSDHRFSNAAKPSGGRGKVTLALLTVRSSTLPEWFLIHRA